MISVADMLRVVIAALGGTLLALVVQVVFTYRQAYRDADGGLPRHIALAALALGLLVVSVAGRDLADWGERFRLPLALDVGALLAGVAALVVLLVFEYDHPRIRR